MKANTLANDVLDHIFNNSASGSVVIGASTYTLPFKVQFLSTLSTASAKGTEMSGGSYPAGGVSIAGQFASAAAAQSKANTGAITVTNAPAGTWADVEIVDSSATPKRLVFKGTPSLAKTINAGDTLTIPVGQLVGTDG